MLPFLLVVRGRFVIVFPAHYIFPLAISAGGRKVKPWLYLAVSSRAAPDEMWAPHELLMAVLELRTNQQPLPQF